MTRRASAAVHPRDGQPRLPRLVLDRARQDQGGRVRADRRPGDLRRRDPARHPRPGARRHRRPLRRRDAPLLLRADLLRKDGRAGDAGAAAQDRPLRLRQRAALPAHAEDHGAARASAPSTSSPYLKTQTDQPVKATCPGPVTLSIHVQTRPGDAYDNDRLALCWDLVPAVNAELKALVAAGADWIQIDEPSAAIVPGQARRVREDVQRLRGGRQGEDRLPRVLRESPLPPARQAQLPLDVPGAARDPSATSSSSSTPTARWRRSRCGRRSGSTGRWPAGWLTSSPSTWRLADGRGGAGPALPRAHPGRAALAGARLRLLPGAALGRVREAQAAGRGSPAGARRSYEARRSMDEGGQMATSRREFLEMAGAGGGGGGGRLPGGRRGPRRGRACRRIPSRSASSPSARASPRRSAPPGSAGPSGGPSASTRPAASWAARSSWSSRRSPRPRTPSSATASSSSRTRSRSSSAASRPA